MRKIAKRNGKEFPAFLFENQKEGSPADERDSLKDPIKVTLVRMLWSSARLRTRMVNMGIQWFAVTLCYYGLSFASTKLSQNVFTDFMLRYCKRSLPKGFCYLGLNFFEQSNQIQQVLTLMYNIISLNFLLSKLRRFRKGVFSFAHLGDGENSWITDKCPTTTPTTSLDRTGVLHWPYITLAPYYTGLNYTGPYYTSP